MIKCVGQVPHSKAAIKKPHPGPAPPPNKGHTVVKVWHLAALGVCAQCRITNIYITTSVKAAKFEGAEPVKSDDGIRRTWCCSDRIYSSVSVFQYILIIHACHTLGRGTSRDELQSRANVSSLIVLHYCHRNENPIATHSASSCFIQTALERVEAALSALAASGSLTSVSGFSTIQHWISVLLFVTCKSWFHCRRNTRNLHPRLPKQKCR